MSILSEIYLEWYSMQEKPREGDREEWDRNEDLWLKASKKLDAELFEELHLSVIHLMEMEACREFEEGFRLGVQLMQELYFPVVSRKNGDGARLPFSSGAAATSYR